MNTSRIETLLGKFYEGTTTLEEEGELASFFGGNEVPEHLRPHQPLFAFYAGEQKVEMKEPVPGLFPFAQSPAHEAAPQVERMHQYRRRLLLIGSVAAGLLILAGLFFTYQYDQSGRMPKKSGTADLRLAYADTREALILVSANLNTGLRQVERLQMVDRAMKNIQLFNKFYQYQSAIINPDVILNQSIKSKQP